MMNLITRFLGISFVIILFMGCMNSRRNQFNKLVEKFNNVNPNIELCDTNLNILFSSEASNTLDSEDVVKYKLFNEWYCPNYAAKTMMEIKPRCIGKFKRSENVVVLLYKGFTCEAGNGNPLVILATFDMSGKKIDNLKLLEWQEKDFLAAPYQVSRIYSDSLIEIIVVNREYGFLNKARVLKHCWMEKVSWSISTEGKIYKIKSVTETLYNDTSHAIVDTLPE